MPAVLGNSLTISAQRSKQAHLFIDLAFRPRLDTLPSERLAHRSLLACLTSRPAQESVCPERLTHACNWSSA
jgi:hypothetical protein